MEGVLHFKMDDIVWLLHIYTRSLDRALWFLCTNKCSHVRTCWIRLDIYYQLFISFTCKELAILIVKLCVGNVPKRMMRGKIQRNSSQGTSMLSNYLRFKRLFSEENNAKFLKWHSDWFFWRFIIYPHGYAWSSEFLILPLSFRILNNSKMT